ncbi:hypothetical protein Val02_43570 [Virgisporangium aliadipatigenens]|uniref:SWIM-type domain-containing protein n=1 Tax=Virgisporangium aliadipatigenens TaxID=741659 RepID=A0A8J4DRU7_9ACTN|nr:hypothetical protein [Virgisporangium aliadipatigenens]GIJ47471.1 hypothetical protein Val02_43570 [Virgisporangium aliadipatigenens]
MSAAELPPVEATVVTAAVDALPNRLRKKLDDFATKVAGWAVSVDGSTVTVTVDETTAVTMTLTGGVVASADAVVCTCLLAPACLHRASVIVTAPVADDAPPSTVDDGPGMSTVDTAAAPADGTTAGVAPGALDGTAAPATDPAGASAAGQGKGAGGSAAGRIAPDDAAATGADLTEQQRAAAEGLWRAAAAALGAGVSGTGPVLRTGLLRAAHEARAVGLHRAAAAGRQVANQLQSARAGDPRYRLADLTDGLRELLGVTHRLRTPELAGDSVGELVGTARRTYDVHGSMRLYGLCAVPVVADTGYGGVVTYVSDRDGRLWTVTDLYPGGAERAAGAGQMTVRLGESALTHKRLARAGLVVSGATASDTGQLGAGKAVRAVSAKGLGWTEEPLVHLWNAPLAEQVARAFPAMARAPQDRTAGSDLLFLRLTVVEAHRDGLLAQTSDGGWINLVVAIDHGVLGFRHNLRLLGGVPGLELLVIGRPDPARRATVQALSAAPAPGENRLALPADWAGHIDLGYDRLHSSHLAAVHPLPPEQGPEEPPPPGEVVPLAVGDPALRLLRRHLERVVSGGRAVQALATPEQRRLAAARLETGAALLGRLTDAARTRPRDAFGRLTDDGGQPFVAAWLAAAVYEEAASAAVAEASWLKS